MGSVLGAEGPPTEIYLQEVDHESRNWFSSWRHYRDLYQRTRTAITFLEERNQQLQKEIESMEEEIRISQRSRDHFEALLAMEAAAWMRLYERSNAVQRVQKELPMDIGWDERSRGEKSEELDGANEVVPHWLNRIAVWRARLDIARQLYVQVQEINAGLEALHKSIEQQLEVLRGESGDSRYQFDAEFEAWRRLYDE